MDMSKPRAHILGCIRSKSGTSRPKSGISLSSILLRLHTEYSVQLWGHPHKDMFLLEQVQRRETKMVRGARTLLLQRQVGAVKPEKRRLCGDLRAFQCLEEPTRKLEIDFL